MGTMEDKGLVHHPVDRPACEHMHGAVMGTIVGCGVVSVRPADSAVLGTAGRLVVRYGQLVSDRALRMHRLLNVCEPNRSHPNAPPGRFLGRRAPAQRPVPVVVAVIVAVVVAVGGSRRHRRSPARDGAQLALQPSLPPAREGEEGVAAGERLPP
jgi:hypothetical protein